MQPEVTIFLYPWDVVAEGVDGVLDAVAATGADRVTIATAYHSAEVIAPRRRTEVVTVAEANRVHTPLPTGSFTELALPPSRIALEHPDLFARLKAGADARGIAVDGWAVAFHNSTLATERPEAAIRSCFGDRFTHGLCASSPTARRYAVELFRAVGGLGLFERVLAESLSYLLRGHGHPHELWAARMDVTTRYLLSLCFCEHCLAAAAAAGIDGQALRAAVAAELTRTWNADYPVARAHDDGTELASLLVGWPDLAAYERMRRDQVTSLVAEVQEICRAARIALDVSAAVWARPVSLNWLEGVDVAQTLQIADGFVLESYSEHGGQVAREVDHVAALANRIGEGAAELTVALTLWEQHHTSDADFLAKVASARAGGATRLGLYNYSTATGRTFGWVPAAVAEFGRGHR